MELDQNIKEAIDSVVEGWYPPGTRMDWFDFLDRVESMSGIDLGGSTTSPLIVAIKAQARKARR